jgi:hypothetical protein
MSQENLPETQNEFNVNDTSSWLNSETRQIQFYLKELAQALKSIPGISVSFSVDRGFFGKIFGDLPYLNFHKKNQKLRSMIIKTSDYEFGARISPEPLFELTALKDSVHPIGYQTVDITTWTKTLTENLRAHSALTSKTREILESMIIGNSSQ